MATGRIIVAPGQTIESATWGNPVWDQSVQCFDSAASRATQFPTPHAGAVTFLADVGRLEVWLGSVWAGIAGTGFVAARAWGTQNITMTAATSSSTLAVTLPAGRFTGPPFVFVAPVTTGNIFATVFSHAAGSFGLRIHSPTSQSITIGVDWVAFQ